MSYNKKVMNYFSKPKNVGEIKDADGIGKVGNITCGDIMYVYIKISKNKKGEDFIKDIKFKTLGCVAAIATSSVVTELAKGKTISKALKITNKQIVNYLGGLPLIKHHCSLLAEDALAEAIYGYFKKSKKPISKELEQRHKKIQSEEEHFHNKFK